MVGALESQILVIDLTRFGELRRDTSGSTHLAEPKLTLFQPDDPLRPPGGHTGAEPPRTSENELGLLQVQVTLSLSADIAVSDPSAARVVKIR